MVPKASRMGHHGHQTLQLPSFLLPGKQRLSHKENDQVLLSNGKHMSRYFYIPKMQVHAVISPQLGPWKNLFYLASYFYRAFQKPIPFYSSCLLNCIQIGQFFKLYPEQYDRWAPGIWYSHSPCSLLTRSSQNPTTQLPPARQPDEDGACGIDSPQTWMPWIMEKGQDLG